MKSPSATRLSCVVDRRIGACVDGLGWPKIHSSEETAEFVARLQELFTYGEAVYLLAQKLPLDAVRTRTIMHPLQTLIDPIRVRFEFHFSGDRQTNRLDKPEWYLTHVLSLLRENLGFLRELVFTCWRLRDIDDFIREGVLGLALAKTRERVVAIRTEAESDGSDGDFARQSLLVHYLVECGRFQATLQDEFGFVDRTTDIVRETLLGDDAAVESFVAAELARVQRLYRDVIGEEESGEWRAGEMAGEPCPVVVQFLSLFHSATVVPYGFVTQERRGRALLLYRVQSWLLEQFHNKCLFDCAPLHSSPEQLLKDIGMVNSMETLCRVLRDDWGETLEYIELAACPVLHAIIGYDPSTLPGTVFNRAIEAFSAIGTKMGAHVFNYAMDAFMKQASLHAGAMVYFKTASDTAELPMNEAFRLAVAALLQTVAVIKKHLGQLQFRQLMTLTLAEKLAAFMYSAVLLRNFFHEAGAERFRQDVDYIRERIVTAVAGEDGSLAIDMRRAFGKVEEAAMILIMKERDTTAPFDAIRVTRSLKEGRGEEIRRFMELCRLTHLQPADLSQIFASRRHAQ